ncbi:Protein of unknown function DUF761, plant [Dillenia turbinata]|uniref:Cotton fiber protein n=1 Tax=Dillenia turbinata TaxID=194707 RepID=A0AAN8ZKD2_9MAGN
MAKKNNNIGRRAWKILRIALLWARKGGAFRRRLMMDLHLLPSYLKSLKHNHSRDWIGYGERQLSFDASPVIHFGMHRPASLRFKLPNIPCINPPVDFDYNFDFHVNDHADAVYDNNENTRKSFLKGGDEEEEYEDCEDVNMVEDEGIDLRAEEFIAKFYEQIKLQRQISYLEYNEMLNRGTR